MKIIILGGRGHAEVIADALLCRVALGEKFEIVGFLDDDPAIKGRMQTGGTILGSIGDLDNYDYDAIIVGIGNNRIRMELFGKFLSHGKTFVTVIHPSAIVAHNVSIGIGTVVHAGAVVNTSSRIGDNAIINTGATVDHHATIGSHVHVGPGARLGGTVTIEEGAFLGVGCSVIPNRTIGAWATVGAGATVIRDIPPGVTAVGTPAKPIVKGHE